MGKSDSLAWTSLTLAIAVGTIAMLLGLRVWWERWTREGELSDVDRKHFFLEDLRRGLGIVLMTFLAFGVYVGSRLPTFVVEPRDPRLGEPATTAAGAIIRAALETHPNRLFLAVWMAVFGSTVLLLGLALIDWISTRRYAQRHRREMDRKRLEILRDTVRNANSTENGLSDGQSMEPI
jgi:hypothetical protein